jgi:glycosyltransferase involved in cell wall biosynthesis
MLKRILKSTALALYKFNTIRMIPYSRICVVPDGFRWVLSQEEKILKNIFRRIGVHLIDPRFLEAVKNQSVFYCSQFIIPSVINHSKNRIAFPYFHGIPGTGYSEFDIIYETIIKHHERINRIQVTNDRIKTIILDTGIDKGKIFKIPIGIDIDLFSLQTPYTKAVERKKLGIKDNMFVIGSFQKDGVGWGNGEKPKLIKGPDIFLKVINDIRNKIPDIFVLLTGPARGYMINGLKRINVPFKHINVNSYSHMNRLYQALDIYLVTSRDEGGPKAILESMACGIILITTKVGQAPEIVIDGENGFIVDSLDHIKIAEKVLDVYERKEKNNIIRENARLKAVAFDYRKLTNMWAAFTDGFIDCAPKCGRGK